MATEPATYRQQHWTASGGVIAVVLAVGLLLPVVGLLVAGTCLVSATRAGTSRTPYVIALVLNVAMVAVYVVQTQITPS
jgi:hypothetical protein